MKTLLSLLLCLWMIPLNAEIPAPGSEGKTPLKWESDFDTALKRAETEKKPLIMDVTTDWCGWSKKMDRETFAKKPVQDLLKECVLIRLNPEASDKNQEVAKKYEANSFPTLMILNHLGEVLAENSGYMDEKEFVKFLEKYLPGFKNNPLGYVTEQLSMEDPLMKAIAKMPKPETLPTHLGSIALLDAAMVKLSPDFSAKSTDRFAWYVMDPDRAPFPQVFKTYNSSRQTLKLKSVRIVDLTGKARHIDVSLAEDEHAYSNQNVYWDVRKVTLPIPSLKPGQILDVIEENEFKPIMPGHFSWNWSTSSMLIVQGDLTVLFPPNIPLKKTPVRCATPIQESKAADGTVTWRLLSDNLNVTEPEFYSPELYDEWQGYEFCTDLTWNSVGDWFRGLCAGRSTLPPEAKARVADLKKANPEPKALLQAVFDWVTKDIRYVSIQFGMSSHQPHPVADTLKNLYGDCKDQALLLQALCREAGLESNLVLVNAGYGKQFTTPMPNIQKFNHCITEVKIGGNSLYLDPSAGPAHIEQLPFHCCMTQALRISDKTTEVISLPSYKPQEQSVEKTIIKLNPNGSATITEKTESRGAPARAAKLQLKGVDVQKIRKQIEDGYKNSGRKLLDFYLTPPDDKGDTYESRISYTLPRFASKSSEGLVFRLGEDSEKGEDWTTALEAPRTRPFRFVPSDVSTVIYEVEMPEGAVLKSKIDNLQITTAYLDASRKITQEGNKIVLTEKSRLLDSKLPPAESPQIAQEFRKLQDHRNLSWIIQPPPPASSPTTPTPSPSPEKAPDSPKK